MPFFNDVKFTSTTSGTASFGIPSSAFTGFQLPATAGMVDDDTHSYSARIGSEFESGLATLNGSVLERTEIDDSSNGGSLVNFSSPPVVALVVLSRDLTATIVLTP